MFDEIVIEQSRGARRPGRRRRDARAKGDGGRPRASPENSTRSSRARDSPGVTEIPIEAAMRELAAGVRSLGGPGDRGARRLVRAIERQMPPAVAPPIDELAPERIRLPGGRQVRVHYEADQPPWIASRLQDFFGMTATPTVGRGVPVVVRLLAPNNRPVQMTTDLAGFWARLYPQLRKELSRRYPKHKWP